MSVKKRSRILVCVQAVDQDDPLMGFFVAWLEEAAKQFESVTVLALRVGRYVLPKNVIVLPLRMERSRSKIGVVWTLLRQSWLRRGSYDAVFVRGDPQYILLTGWLWRLLGKKVVFWYAHYRVSRWAKLATMVASSVVSSSLAASVGLRNVKILGQGIDERRFPFVPRSTPTGLNCLVFGRMDRSKRIDLIIRAFKQFTVSEQVSLAIVGPPASDLQQRAELERLVANDPRIHWLLGRVPYQNVPSLLTEYTVLLNATDASLDKTIIEAALSGTIPLASTAALREWLPLDLQWLHVATEEEMTQALVRCAELSATAYLELTRRLHLLASQNHSLVGQMTRLKQLIVE